MKNKPTIQLPELDSPEGNVFHIIAMVSKALKKNGMKEQATEFVGKAFGSETYQAVLTIASEYVEIE